MQARGMLILLSLVLAAGCTSAAPSPTAAHPSPTREPPPTETPAVTPTIDQMIDDFEAGTTAWQAGTADVFSDSSSLSVALSPEHASQGAQSLQLKFELTDKPKAIVYLDRPLDLSQARTLRLDIYNPGTVAGVGVAFTTGAQSVWYESDSHPVAAGKTTSLVFDLSASNYKAASTNWEFRTSIADLASVSRLAVILYPARSGSVFLDNLYLSRTPPSP